MGFNISERYLIALNILLIGLIAYLAARSVSDVIALRLASNVVPAESESPAAGSHGAEVHSRVYYNAILQRDVFNLAPASENTAPVVEEDLQLRLLGTSHLTEGKPFAIIENVNNEQALYRLGDTIPNAGKLIEVDKDRAIILHNGHRVALVIPRENMPAVPRPFGGERLKRRNFRGERRRMGAADGPGVQKLGADDYLIARSKLNQDLSNMTQLFTQIRATPNMENGSVKGFRLSEIMPGSLFQQIGLQDGDLLTAVSGQPVGDPTKEMELFQNLRNQDSISVSVIRNGSPLELHYNIR